MRPLVHDPRKTVSTATSRIGVPGSSAMYVRARSTAAVPRARASPAMTTGTPTARIMVAPPTASRTTIGMKAAR